MVVGYGGGYWLVMDGHCGGCWTSWWLVIVVFVNREGWSSWWLVMVVVGSDSD